MIRATTAYPVIKTLADLRKRLGQILVRAEQSLDGGDVLPGFVLRVTDLLDRGRRPRMR
jgi:hypothetical protein